MTDCSLAPFSIITISPHLLSSLLFPRRMFNGKYNTIFLHISSGFFFFLILKVLFHVVCLPVGWTLSLLHWIFLSSCTWRYHGVGGRQWMWLLLTIHSVYTLEQWAGIMLSSDFSKGSVVNRTEISKIKHVEQSLPSSLPSQRFTIFCLPEKEGDGRRKGKKSDVCLKGFFRFSLEEIMSFYNCSFSLIEFSPKL